MMIMMMWMATYFWMSLHIQRAFLFENVYMYVCIHRMDRDSAVW
jgi:hypothetical protein